MNQFIERYKSSTNTDLLRIIENKSEYQQEAIEAAEFEISQRKLTELELEEANKELEVEKQLKVKQIDKRKKIEEKVNTIGVSFFDTINPYPKEGPTTDRIIRSISIVFGFITLYTWYKEFIFIQYMFSDSATGWDMSTLEYLFPIIILPVVAILFWKKKRIAWILLCAYLTYLTLSALGFLLLTWEMEAPETPSMYNLFPQTPASTHIFRMMFNGAILWLINKGEIIDSFKISRKTAFGTMIITGVLTLLIIIPFFF